MPTKQTDPQAALAAALNQAQGAAGAVSKASRNDYHRYKYASAEALIEEGRSALHGAGLALVPDSQSIELGTGDGLSVLKRTYTILHSGGGMLTMAQEWPVIPEKGRPMDKAVASAVTASLGYFLRDLLLMPRVDPADDLDSNTRETGRGRDKQPGNNRSRHGDQRTTPPAPARGPRNDAAPLPGNWKGLGDALNLDEAGHDPAWNDERSRFHRKLREIGVKYEDLATHCAEHSMGKPSSVGTEGRSHLIRELMRGNIPELLEVSTTGTPSTLL